MANNSLEKEQVLEKKGGVTKLCPALFDLVQREVNKILKEKKTERVNFAHISEYACNFYLGFNTNSNMPNNFWITDTRATCHIYAFCEYFENIKDLGKEISIHMPNYSFCPVHPIFILLLTITVGVHRPF